MSQQIAPPVPSSTVDEPLIYRAIDVQRHGTSYILQFLNDGDLLACAKTSRYFRHLAFSLYFRDLTFHIHPPLDEASTNGKGSLMIDDEAEEELAESRDGDDGEESSGSDTDESEESGVEDDGIPDDETDEESSSEDSLTDDGRSASDENHKQVVDAEPCEGLPAAGVERARFSSTTLGPVSSLEDVITYLSERVYATRYIQSLELNVHHKETPYFCSAFTFTALLHHLPNIRNIWLKNVLLTRLSVRTGAVTDVLPRIALRHLCIDIVDSWRTPPANARTVFRNLLMPFLRIEDLRVRNWLNGLRIPIAPMPAHLEVNGVTLGECVQMPPLLDALRRHEKVHLLHTLVLEEDVSGCRRSSANTWAVYDLLRVVGMNLKHFGFGALTLYHAFHSTGDLHSKKFKDALRRDTFGILRPDRLHTFTVQVILYEPAHYSLCGDRHNAWTEHAWALRVARTQCASSTAGVHTICVRVLANASPAARAVPAFCTQIAKHRRVCRILEKELLAWAARPAFARVVVDFPDRTVSHVPDIVWAREVGAARMFPRLHAMGKLSVQDERVVQERWHH